MKLLLFCLLSVVAIGSSTNVAFKDCGSALASGVKVDVQPCPGAPCPLKQGSNYTITITFQPNKAVNSINAAIHGIVAGVPVPFPFDHPNACDGSSGLHCPLAAGTTYKYSATLPVKSEYPAIKLYVQWELTDMDSNGDLVCVEIPVAVVKADNDELDFGYHKVKTVRHNGFW